MAIVEFLRPHFHRLHQSQEQAIQDLTPEQFHWLPSGNGNHIAFTIWHCVRTEDNVTRFVLQNRRPTIWLENGWNEKFGLDRIAQGTGMSHDDATDVRFPSVADFTGYMQDVWRATEEYLASLRDEDLGHVVTIKPRGEFTVGDTLQEIVLTHQFSHLGEIWALRGLQRLQGAPR